MIAYKAIYNSATEPTSKTDGDMWIKPINNVAYQVYIYLSGMWRILLGGGQYIAETNPDTHYYNIIFDTNVPDASNINVGWFWFNQSTNELFIYNGTDFISMLAI